MLPLQASMKKFHDAFSVEAENENKIFNFSVILEEQKRYMRN